MREKFRVIETTAGAFYPQVKAGLFWWWRFFNQSTCEPIVTMHVLSATTTDPLAAVVRKTEDEALVFIEGYKAAIERACIEREAARRRSLAGVATIRVIGDKTRKSE